ncbi:unnamed protein product [Toxocara canis]|uniref:DUF5641 domain-containing protein n=1 Tax=Toxocara canis TaxID=6265 RepID=A0A183UTW2_TOXCA|nr:unnamed protein product [Toxocara canis]
MTKRTLLSWVASIFNPFGYLTPAKLPIKIFIQALWHMEYLWGDVLKKAELQRANTLIQGWHNQPIIIKRQIGQPTLLSECEAIVNSRPLTYVGKESLHVIQPIDLIAPVPIKTMEVVVRTEADADSGEKYYPTINNRDKLLDAWSVSANEPRVGQVVLIQDESKPRTPWKLGITTKLIEGTDGKICSAELQFDSQRKINRPVILLSRLEISASVASSPERGQLGNPECREGVNSGKGNRTAVYGRPLTDSKAHQLGMNRSVITYVNFRYQQDFSLDESHNLQPHAHFDSGRVLYHHFPQSGHKLISPLNSAEVSHDPINAKLQFAYELLRDQIKAQFRTVRRSICELTNAVIINAKAAPLTVAAGMLLQREDVCATLRSANSLLIYPRSEKGIDSVDNLSSGNIPVIRHQTFKADPYHNPKEEEPVSLYP